MSSNLLTSLRGSYFAQGHINHTLFWKNLAPASQGGGQLENGPLKKAIERDFGSVDSVYMRVYGVLSTY